MSAESQKITQPAVTTPPLAADDPRLSPEAIERRRTLKIAERDEFGRLLPGSILPNPGRKGGPLVTTLARQHTEQAVALLAEVMLDPKAPQAARVTAAQALLDRGWGKAPIQIDLNVRAKFDDFLREVGIEARAARDQAEEEAEPCDTAE
jgi:hypothetical protein